MHQTTELLDTQAEAATDIVFQDKMDCQAEQTTAAEAALVEFYLEI
jgi:hypothetical protein